MSLTRSNCNTTDEEIKTKHPYILERVQSLHHHIIELFQKGFVVVVVFVSVVVVVVDDNDVTVVVATVVGAFAAMYLNVVWFV